MAGIRSSRLVATPWGGVLILFCLTWWFPDCWGYHTVENPRHTGDGSRGTGGMDVYGAKDAGAGFALVGDNQRRFIRNVSPGPRL